MRSLKKGNTGKEVKILQGLLNIHGYKCSIDGSFGPGTTQIVKKLQEDRGLTVDGSVGPITWKSLGVMTSYNPKIAVFKIPFSAITEQAILLKNNKKYSVGKFSAENPKYNFIVNAGMFDMRTLRNVQDMVIAGKVDNGGNYTDKGLALCNNRSTGCIYPSTTSNCSGKPVDFIGGSPSLIWDGVKKVDLKGLSKSYYNSVTKRVCYGCDDNNFYLLMTINNCSLEAMVNEGLKQGVKALINEDGGGSQSIAMAGTTVIPTDGRAIPSVLALAIKPFNGK